jgi:hypothetical protein
MNNDSLASQLRDLPVADRPRSYMRTPPRQIRDLNWRFACWVVERPVVSGVTCIGISLIVGVGSWIQTSNPLALVLFGVYGITVYAYTLVVMRGFVMSCQALRSD